MREFKFRVWLPNYSKMVSDYFTISSTGEIAWTSDAAVLSDSKNIVLMQYTGLKDKNGKEIYEGDILRYAAINRIVAGWDLNFVVYWDDDYQGFMMRLTMRGVTNPPTDHIANEDKESTMNVPEVIGNIYENQELLK